MRTARAVAVFLGALIIGVLSAAMPAQATGKPTVRYLDTCSDVRVTVNNPLRLDIVVKVSGHVGELKVAKHDSETVTVPKADNIQAQVRFGQAWINLGGPHSWSDPGRCLPPTVTVTEPTCDKPDLTVVVTNPNKRGRLFVRFNGGPPRLVKAGESTTFTGRADVTVAVNGKTVKTVAYVAPKDCATPTATATPSETGQPEPSDTAAPGGNPGGDKPQLPVTGPNVGVVVSLGVLLVLGGGGLALLAARRRRTTSVIE